MLALALLDDHPAVLIGLRRLLEPQPDMTVIAAAATVDELSRQLNGSDPDVLVVDYDLARGDGLMHCLQVKRRSRPPTVVIYSAYCGDGLALAARAAGADALIGKAEPVPHLLSAIRRAATGRRTLPDVPHSAYQAAVAALDDEDLPILAMLLDRAPVDDIARALNKSRAQVSWQSQRIIARLRPTLGTRKRPDVPDRDERMKLA
jgi:DNA-binding NarL/FixJ family response regulator